MKLFFFSFILFAIISLENTTPKEENELYWSKSRKLAWSDFKARVSDSLIFSAASSVKLKLNYEVRKKIISIQLFCLFAKNESWYRDTNNYVLNHEQKHFDIGELVIRMMRKQVDSLSKVKEKLNIKSIEKLFDAYYLKLKEMQDLYDKETDHSKNFGGQIRWNGFVDEELENLEEFEDSFSEYIIKRG